MVDIVELNAKTVASLYEQADSHIYTDNKQWSRMTYVDFGRRTKDDLMFVLTRHEDPIDKPHYRLLVSRRGRPPKIDEIGMMFRLFMTEYQYRSLWKLNLFPHFSYAEIYAYPIETSSPSLKDRPIDAYQSPEPINKLAVKILCVLRSQDGRNVANKIGLKDQYFTELSNLLAYQLENIGSQT